MSALYRRNLQDAGDDAGIGYQDETKWCKDDQCCGYNDLLFIQRGVSAGEPDEGGNITEEVVNILGPTKWQREHPSCLHHRDNVTTATRQQDQRKTNSGVHDDCISKGVAYGHVTVIGHGCQNVAFSGC